VPLAFHVAAFGTPEIEAAGQPGDVNIELPKVGFPGADDQDRRRRS
jgi:hypothetical protein